MPALPALANTTTLELQQVICSWPLSGQYGVGSRLLYYVLVAACVLARKSEWLRNACLAAALIFPAIAAIHAIVLAALHVDDAIDMDIYGALQLCSIGVLTAPATVRLSKTYFNNPGRNVLFIWTALMLAGLLALTVEFFRSNSKPCTDDGFGRPLYRGSDFPYDETTCGLICAVGNGPYSPMRDGSADNIYVVPAPYILNFGAATLIAAASCVPGILSMVSIWNKIAKTNWRKQFGAPDVDEVIEGTNGATVKGMKSVNNVIRRLIGFVEVPVFGGGVLAVIVAGELNFWSKPLYFQTEPIANIGQWSNVLASVFAACGSLYMLLARYLDRAEKGILTEDHLEACNCTCHGHGSSGPGSLSDNTETAQVPRPAPARTTDADLHIYRQDTASTHMLSPIRTETYPDSEDTARGLGIHTIDSNSSTGGNRHEVTKALLNFAATFGTASSGNRFDDHAFRTGKVTGFPEIPGEFNRNVLLPQIKQQWGEPSADIEDGLTPRGRRSRANSFNGSLSRSNSIGPRARSPQPPPPAPPRSPTAAGPSTSMLGLPTTHSPESTSESIFPSRPSAELDKTKSQSTVITLHQGPNSPAIVLSSEDEPSETPESVGVVSPPLDTLDSRDGPPQHDTAEQQAPLPVDGPAGGEIRVPPPTEEKVAEL
ncbi:hypothetical protein C8A01DRAFT_49373 [Parachaetomium inaequale]|uniref:Uncharacterized protein n=1 Tax=Parachaetomium inaequale TaxID=2588326 RepID=A0AAN6PD56_9PEZI|nr:hypothetical protein C8A01DRAFT_49373 [Parachaetomium inaequale]